MNPRGTFLNSHFAPAFYALKSDRRKALSVIYDFFRLLDDAVDQKTVPNPALFLSCWRDTIQNGEAGLMAPFGQEKLARDLLGTLKTFDIPSFAILDFIDKGMMADVDSVRIETSMDLERYCYGVAGTVGLASLPIFGVPWQEAKEFAVRLGVAVQWINTIRDVGTDAGLGRLYLPLDHLERFQCDVATIFALSTTNEFLALMDYEARAARGHFQRALELMPAKWEKELLPARIMGNIYLKLLEKIENHRYAVLTKRIRLNLFEKAIATWRAIKTKNEYHSLEKRP